MHTNTVGSDYKGFNVYRYRVRVQAGGHETKQDPEIIIEWP